MKQPRWSGILSFCCAQLGSVYSFPSLSCSLFLIDSLQLSVLEQLHSISPGRRFLVHSLAFTHTHRPTRVLVPLSPFTYQTKVGLLTQKVFCTGSVGRSVACFPYFHLFSFLPFPLFPSPVSGWGVCGEQETQTQRREMKAQSSKTHQHEY